MQNAGKTSFLGFASRAKCKKDLFLGFCTFFEVYFMLLSFGMPALRIGSDSFFTFAAGKIRWKK